MTPTEAAALMRRAAARIDELVATYFPNPGVVQDVFDLSAELKAAAVELEHTETIASIDHNTALFRDTPEVTT